MNEIRLRGARLHNLKNISLTIPRDALTVFTGLSGCGKSSLAFDTLYAEGHRRFVESLSSYARMFLGQLDKPDIDSVEGLSPAIAIDQKTTSKNPRSTVGTVTEIYDYLRLLYARLGVPHCPVCGREIRQRGLDQILDEIMMLPQGERFLVVAPVVRGKKGRHEKIFADALKRGFIRARIDGVVTDIVDEMDLDKNKKHTIELVIDRLVMRPELRSRLSDSVETAMRESGDSVIIVTVPREGEAMVNEYSTRYACVEHGISFGELEPRMFSFNNPFGACEKCAGIGVLRSVSPEKMMPDMSLSLEEGGIAVNGFKSLSEESWTGPLLMAVGKAHDFRMDQPLSEFSPEAMRALLYGTGEEMYDVVRYFGKMGRRQLAKWDGVVNIVNSRVNMNSSEADYYEQFMEETDCPDCGGRRLNAAALSVTVGMKNIVEFCDQPIAQGLAYINALQFTPTEETIAREIMKELRSRLGFLINVGLEYLTLSRRAGTLSGGEAQRIRLATQIGSALTGVMYVLDEPSIGLHQRDNARLISTLQGLRDLGNTVLVVEHDEETMLAADYLVDIGPGAGIHGGEVVYAGAPAKIGDCAASITGQFLTGKRSIPVPASRRSGNGQQLSIYGAQVNNLKNIDVKIPLGCFVCVTGVSGSGKSSLVNGILYPALARKLNRASTWPGKHRGMDGMEALDKIIAIDQSPIGRTPRSNPATYTGLFTDIRELFAKTPSAKARGYTAGRFSFNTKGGRCDACEGDGVKCIEMHFLPDVYVKCDVCHGARYNRDTLEVKYKDKSIADVLQMPAEEACEFFADIPRIASRIKTICDVGLGYVTLGQAATTLSGGEAQRVKLATELSKRSTGKTIYVLDEPTTGLHTADVDRLILILQRLVDAGNTVLVIEHNLDVIKVADHIIDMGPEGGDAGGTVIAQGTPEEVAAVERSHTGRFLREKLGM